MKKIIVALFALILCVAGCSRNQANFDNPVIRGDMADPSVIRIGDTYYLTATSSEWAPHYPMFESKDLVNWTQTGHVFDKNPEWTSGSFWAPELYHMNDMVYCYYTARRVSDGRSQIGVATAAGPSGPFTDHGIIIEHGNEAIDAFVFDDGGQLYITWKAYGLDERPIELIGSKLSADGLRLEGEHFTILCDDERIGMEGQYHFKDGDYYYIIYSTRGCCGPNSDYEVYAARSKSFEGPYEGFAGNPVLTAGEDFISCGHGTGVETPDGRIFYICHAYFAGDGFYQGRQPILQEMKISEDRWPYFTSGTMASVKQEMPFRKTVQQPAQIFTDNFEDEKIDPAWSWNFTFSDARIKTGGGKLMLGGNPRRNNGFGTALCLRPQSPHYSIEVRTVNNPDCFQGITMYGDDHNLLAWGTEDGKLILRNIRQGNETILAENEYTIGEVFLKMEVIKGRLVTFFWSADGNQWSELENQTLDASPLTRWDRVARPGLLHDGPADSEAVFSSFKMTLL